MVKLLAQYREIVRQRVAANGSRVADACVPSDPPSVKGKDKAAVPNPEGSGGLNATRTTSASAVTPKLAAHDTTCDDPFVVNEAVHPVRDRSNFIPADEMGLIVNHDTVDVNAVVFARVRGGSYKYVPIFEQPRTPPKPKGSKSSTSRKNTTDEDEKEQTPPQEGTNATTCLSSSNRPRKRPEVRRRQHSEFQNFDLAD